ncbi:MAG: nuclear transport factor 2 family protein [Myxococcales bacterium]|nr:nuclear transport factor 2 family protein [Myxococcales bacterium]
MKTRSALLALLLLAAASAPAHAGSSSGERRALRALLAKYNSSAEHRDVGAMASVLHERYRLTVKMGAKLLVIDKKAYLNMLRAKKLGGEKRAMNVASIDVTGNVGHIKVRFTGRKARFVEYLSLLRDGQGWRILGSTAQITK